jgi:hypothetical protein
MDNIGKCCNLQSAHYFVQRRKKPKKKNQEIEKKEVKPKHKKGGYEGSNTSDSNAKKE